MLKLLTYSTLLLNTLSFTPQRALEQQYTDYNARVPVCVINSGSNKAFLSCDFAISSLVDNDLVSQSGYTPEMYFLFKPYISNWSSSPSDYTFNFDTFIFEENFTYLDPFAKDLNYIEITISSWWTKSAKTFDLLFEIDYYFVDNSVDNFQIFASDETGSVYHFNTNYGLSGISNLNNSFKIYRNQLYNYYDVGVDRGFQSGLDANANTQTFLDNIWDFVDNATTAVFNVLDIQILPGIPLYAIVIIPLCICLLFIVMKWLGE